MLNKMVVGIGAQKAGTTWLYEYFKRHPEIYVSPIKELHFFDSLYRKDFFDKIDENKFLIFKKFTENTTYDDLIKDREKCERLDALNAWALMQGSQERYERFFRERVALEKFVCDITPSYSMLDIKGFKAIKNTAKEVKIVFILRNPIDRFWSALKMADRTGHANKNTDFEDMLKSPDYLLRGDYARTFRILNEVFEKNNILILFYERLTNSTEVGRLCDFLGISKKFYDIGFVNSDTKKESLIDSKRAVAYESFRTTYEWAEATFEKIPDSWKNDITKFGKS